MPMLTLFHNNTQMHQDPRLKVRYILALLVSLSLIGCASAPSVTEVPVPVPCKTAEPIAPDLHFSPPYSNVFDGTRDLLGDREATQGYVTELVAALRSCK